MKPSSSTSDLFGAVLARGPVADAVADAAWLEAMLRVEAALAAVHAKHHVISEEAADEIAGVARAELIDLAALDAGEAGNPVVPLVAQLRGLLRHPDAVHVGATSQDILDTAAMLVATRALGLVLEDLAGAAAAARGLAAAHRDTRIIGRTLLQQAVPTTFGLKAAGWLVALAAAGDRLELVRRERLAVQLGGAAGTLAPLGDKGPAVVADLATYLGLAAPLLPWHTDRLRIADLAAALGATCGVAGKIARDLTLLAQNEVGEVTDGSPGGSSAMAHKKNPVAAVCAAGCAAAAPGLVADLFAAMAHEHERAAGNWHAEWRPLRELLVATGSAVSWLRAALERVQVDPERMRANLAASGIESPGPDACGVLVDQALDAVREVVHG
jgi:3-carboxy-cis,cis-muconate cycloisomerase